MDFFDKVKKTAASVVAVSGKESKRIYSIAKLKLEIGEKQNAVKSLYKEIGFDAYKAYKANISVEETIKEKLLEIDSLEDEIASLRKKVDDVKNTDEVGIDDIEVDDALAEDAVVVDDVEEAEPIEPIE